MPRAIKTPRDDDDDDMTRPKLTYLDMRGIAEPIRACFRIGGVEFDDVRVSYEDVRRLRETLPFGQVPTLELDGRVYSQSGAILRCVGRITGLYPSDEETDARLWVDMILDVVRDVNQILAPVWYSNVFPRTEGELREETHLEEEEVGRMVHLVNTVMLPPRVKQIENFVASSSVEGPFVCGAKLTVADLSLHRLLTGLGPNGDYCDGVCVLELPPRLALLVEAVERIDGVIS